MKHIILKYISLIFFISIFSGCASSKLTLELSLYKDNPEQAVPTSLEDVAFSEEYIANIENNLKSVVDTKNRLADIQYDLYEHYYISVNEAKAEKINPDEPFTDAMAKEDLYILSGFRDEYKYLVEKHANTVNRYVRISKMQSRSLISAIKNQSKRTKVSILEKELKLSLNDISQSINKLLNLANTPFQMSLDDRWGSIISSAASERNKELLGEEKYKTINDELINFTKRRARFLQQMNSKIIELKPSIASEIDSLLATQSENITRLPSFVKAPDIYKTSEVELSLLRQASKALNAQLERLQDPGSAIWRIVTAPENKDKWNTQFSKTHFYAEGNSGVVIVRESPIEYRIQEAANNPAALVQAQLGVSRAIASAAIQIAGANMGNLLVNTSNSNGTISTADNTSYQTDTESIILKKATYKEKEKIRSLSLRVIAGNLKAKLKVLKPLVVANEAEIDDLRSDIVTMLKARKSHFKTQKGDVQ